MTEVEKLRALLAEAQDALVRAENRMMLPPHQVPDAIERIDAALAESVSVHPSSLTDVVTLLENERDEARAEVKRLRFSLKRVATSLEIVCSKWTKPAFERGQHLPMIRADYQHILEVLGRAMPIPEDKR